MNRKHRKTLAAIFAEPTLANISWDDAVSLFESLAATVTPSSASMFGFDLGGVTAVFHRPHPGHELPKALVRRFRRFLENAGFYP
ncbi:MAG: hypothetical protein JWO68_4121 [Actinomycetia bacterium]|nr:hypothetical protein [Actinomycetes bacterium]